jgi:hypothetical protein
MCQISIDAGMGSALKAGLKQYQPVCGGVKLDPECGDPETTTRNLHQIVSSSPGRSILAVISSANGQVLIVFKTGETYLATGYSIGSDGPGTAALARFLIEHNNGDWMDDYDWMHRVLINWPPDMAGPVALPSK